MSCGISRKYQEQIRRKKIGVAEARKLMTKPAYSGPDGEKKFHDEYQVHEYGQDVRFNFAEQTPEALRAATGEWYERELKPIVDQIMDEAPARLVAIAESIRDGKRTREQSEAGWQFHDISRYIEGNPPSWQRLKRFCDEHGYRLRYVRHVNPPHRVGPEGGILSGGSKPYVQVFVSF